MKYFVDVNGDRLEVEVDGAHARLAAGGPDATLDPPDEGPVRLVRIGASVYRVEVRPGQARGSYTLSSDGHRYEVEALDERTRAIRDLTAAAAGPAGAAPLVAPMPGLIVRVNVQVGDRVQPGQGLVVMEAMKMENELRTHAAGTVKAVLVEAGAAVEKGARLVELE